jgi:glycosyltransferase involved in cell wall biosynthesis
VKENPTYGNNSSLDHPKILYLNSFKTFRKVDLLIEAIPLVVQALPNVHFEIIGAANEEELEKYKSIAFDIKQISHKHLHIDLWARNPSEYFEKAHLYVLPATLIFCNNSLLEAMERGIPAVVTKADHVELLVVDGHNGYVAEYTPASLAKSILNVIQNPELHKQMALNSRKLIEEKYDDESRLQIIFDKINKS